MAWTLKWHDSFASAANGGSQNEYDSIYGRTPDTVANGGTWDYNGAFRLHTGGLTLGRGGGVGIAYPTISISEDQAAEIKVAGRQSYFLVGVRFATGSGEYNWTGYCAIWTDSTLYLRKVVAQNLTGGTDLDSSTPSFTQWDRLRIEATGSASVSLKVYINDVEELSATDSSSPIAGGKPFVFADVGSETGDDFKAWEWSADAATFTPRIIMIS